MTALDELERSLARAVQAGAAADPARAGQHSARAEEPLRRDLPDASSAARAGRRTRRRIWRGRGRGWHIFVAILLAGGVTTGSLAATGHLPVIGEDERPYIPMVPDTGAGVPASRVTVMPLRVADPIGGPPWVLRTFTTNRKAACVQAGQLLHGRFGVVERDERNRTVFRLVGIHIGETARCTNLVQDGLPVFRGLRQVQTIGGSGTRARCKRADGSETACPMESVRFIRYGLLGPAARHAQFVRIDGSPGPGQVIRPGTGGAYLLVDKGDPRPYREAEAIDVRAQREVEAAYPSSKKPRSSMTVAERRAQNRVFQRQLKLRIKLYKRDQPLRRRLFRRLLGQDAVDATFDGGAVIRVAGRHVKFGHRLPGVVPFRDDLPAALPATVTANFRGLKRAVDVRFRAPVALERYARHFRVTVRGPVSPGCRHVDSAIVYMDRATRKGAAVRVPVRSADRDDGVHRWCAGARYTARVVHHSGSYPGGTDRPIGSASFTAR